MRNCLVIENNGLLVIGVITTLLILLVFNGNKQKDILADDLNEKTNEDIPQIENKNEQSPIFSDKSYTIGLISPEGIKIRIPNDTKNIKYAIMNRTEYNYHGLFISWGYYNATFDEHYRHDTSNEYSYDQYREDIVFSIIFHDHRRKEEDLKNHDYVFIPPIGIELTEEFSKNLFNFIEQSRINYPNACAYQTYMKEEERKQNGIGWEMKGFTPDFPNLSYRTYGGLLFKSEDLGMISKWLFRLWFRNRFDVYVQHYCEVKGEEIVVSGDNMYEPVISF